MGYMDDVVRMLAESPWLITRLKRKKPWPVAVTLRSFFSKRGGISMGTDASYSDLLASMILLLVCTKEMPLELSWL